MQRKMARRTSRRKATPPTMVPISAPSERRPYFWEEFDFKDAAALLLLLVGDVEVVMVDATVAVCVGTTVCVGTDIKADVPWAIAGASKLKLRFDPYML